MPRHVLLPCTCGRIHRIPDPGKAASFHCKTSNQELTYQCYEGEAYRLRDAEEDILFLQPAMTLGRSRRCDIALINEGLSRVHCRFVLGGDGVSVEDLKSRNGVYVNEERIPPSEPFALTPGDLVRVADRIFRYMAPEPAELPDHTEAGTSVLSHADLRPAGPDGNADASSEAEGPEADRKARIVGAPSTYDWVGRVIGRYRITAALGEGGMGQVCKAVDTPSGLEIVLKILPRIPLANRGTEEQAVRRFRREIELAGRLDHPSIAKVLGAGEEPDLLYLVMEYVPGAPLRELYARERASLAVTRRVGLQVLEALMAAHDIGIVHRDITPRNLMQLPDGRVKVIDFGIAKLLRDPDFSRITASGSSVGTPRYMAPEQFTNPSDADDRADLYALAGVLYFMLAGRAPREGKSVVTVMRTLHAPPPRLAQAGRVVPEAWEAFIQSGLAPDPADRYLDAEEMQAALKALPTEER